MRRPEIDLSACNGCGACIEVSPAVFSFNDLGFVQVADLDVYPEAEVDEAIALCPEDCITWEE
jgi:ferredoxin